MNIEYITDADYDSIPKAKAAMEFNHPIGPPFNVAAWHLSKTALMKAATASRSMKIDKYKQR